MSADSRAVTSTGTIIDEAAVFREASETIDRFAADVHVALAREVAADVANGLRDETKTRRALIGWAEVERVDVLDARDVFDGELARFRAELSLVAARPAATVLAAQIVADAAEMREGAA